MLVRFVTYILCIFLISCKRNYPIETFVPSQNAKVTSVFPKQIDKEKAVFSRLVFMKKGWLGFQAIYGKDKFEIRILQSVNKDKVKVKHFFQEYVFKEYTTITTDSFFEKGDNMLCHDRNDPQFELFAWTNQNWIFIVRANKNNSLDTVMNALLYLNR